MAKGSVELGLWSGGNSFVTQSCKVLKRMSKYDKIDGRKFITKEIEDKLCAMHSKILHLID